MNMDGSIRRVHAWRIGRVVNGVCDHNDKMVIKGITMMKRVVPGQQQFCAPNLPRWQVNNSKYRQPKKGIVASSKHQRRPV